MAETGEREQGTPRRAAGRRGGRTIEGAPAEGAKANRAHRPIRTIRMSRVRAAIRANHTDTGVLYRTTFERIYKPDGEDQWKSSDSFGPDDLLLLAKVANEAHTWILRQRGMDDVS